MATVANYTIHKTSLPLTTAEMSLRANAAEEEEADTGAWGWASSTEVDLVREQLQI